MTNKINEYKEMFLAEALDNYEELNQLFTDLEKDNSNKRAIDAIFRITHTLKGNAMGMGFLPIAELGHVMEDVFSEVKQGNLVLDNTLFNTLFQANDKLGELIEALKTDEVVKYKGIRTKLKVILNNIRSTDEQVAKENKVEKSAANLTETKQETQEEKIQEEATQVEATQEEEIEVEATQVEATQEEEIEVEATQVEVTQVEVTQVEVTQEEATQEEVTQEEATQEEATQEEEIEVEVTQAEEIEAEDEAEDEAVDDNQPKIAFSDLVQIPVRKLDALLNLVGELIIERDSLIAQAIENGTNTNRYTRLQRITSDLQYGVMDVRMVQVGFLFKKFSRVIRDVANIENKNVDLILKGTENEIDRNILKIMSDSLVHLVRNAVSHGIEKPEVRIKNGKPETGLVTLNARNEKDTVIIEVIDDGNGIDPKIIKKKAIEKGMVSQENANSLSDEEIIMFIFEPGFSNMDQITEVSGRGVGMDVVKRATESIGGKIEVASEIGKGSVVSLYLPSSMAVKGALLFELNNQEYAVALTYTEAVISLKKTDIHKAGAGLMSKYLGKTISVVFLQDLMRLNHISDIANEGVLHQSFNKISDDDKLDVLVASHGNKYVGIVVDKLLQQKEIVEKTLSKPVDNIELISGSTILGNGNVCLVLDIARVINILFKEKMTQKL